MTLESRVAKLEGAGVGLADGCNCRGDAGVVEALLDEDEPVPVCAVCGRPVRVLRIIQQVISVDDVH